MADPLPRHAALIVQLDRERHTIELGLRNVARTDCGKAAVDVRPPTDAAGRARI